MNFNEPDRLTLQKQMQWLRASHENHAHIMHQVWSLGSFQFNTTAERYEMLLGTTLKTQKDLQHIHPRTANSLRCRGYYDLVCAGSTPPLPPAVFCLNAVSGGQIEEKYTFVSPYVTVWWNQPTCICRTLRPLVSMHAGIGQMCQMCHGPVVLL